MQAFLFFLDLDMVLRNSTPEEFTCIKNLTKQVIWDDCNRDPWKERQFTFCGMFSQPPLLWYLKLPNTSYSNSTCML